jgi:uncharacterized glyoxalase superfamily protein PhnB
MKTEPLVASVIHRAATYLLVADVARALRHYRDVLGFEIEYAQEPLFGIVRRGGATLMLKLVDPQKPLVPNEAQGGTWDAFLFVSGLDALFAELRARGAAVVYPPTQQPYGYVEFAVRDLDGYVLGFGEERR